MGYKVNPITGELDTYGYTPDAQPGLQAPNGWAQKVPPEILQRLLAGDNGGRITDPATGMTYHIANGQGGSGAQYVFAEDGHAGPGREFPNYDLSGNYLGAAKGAGNTSIAVPLAAALAMATFGGSLAGAGLGGAEGAAGAAGADGGWGLTNALVNGGVGTDLSGMAAAGTGATVLPSAAADGGWGLLNQVVTQGPGTDLAGLAGAGTGATVLPSVASAGGGLLSGLLPEGASKLLGPAAALLGAAAGSQGVKSSQSQTRDIPEWLKPSVNGLLGYTNQKLAADVAPGALAGYDQMKQLGQGLMAAPVAGNGFGLLTKGRY